MIKIYEIIEVPNMPVLYTSQMREHVTLPYIILSGSEDNYHVVLCDILYKGIQLDKNYSSATDYVKVINKLIFRIIYPIKKDTININDEYNMTSWIRLIIDNGKSVLECKNVLDALKFLLFSRYNNMYVDNHMTIEAIDKNYFTLLTVKEGHEEDPYNDKKETHYKIKYCGNDKMIHFTKYYKHNSIYYIKNDSNLYNGKFKIDNSKFKIEYEESQIKKIINDILSNRSLRNMIYDDIKNI